MELFSTKKLIEDEVIKNLLTAHKRMVEYSGTPNQIIQLSRYILRLAKKRKDELIEKEGRHE